MNRKVKTGLGTKWCVMIDNETFKSTWQNHKRDQVLEKVNPDLSVYSTYKQIIQKSRNHHLFQKKPETFCE